MGPPGSELCRFVASGYLGVRPDDACMPCWAAWHEPRDCQVSHRGGRQRPPWRSFCPARVMGPLRVEFRYLRSPNHVADAGALAGCSASDHPSALLFALAARQQPCARQSGRARRSSPGSPEGVLAREAAARWLGHAVPDRPRSSTEWRFTTGAPWSRACPAALVGAGDAGSGAPRQRAGPAGAGSTTRAVGSRHTLAALAHVKD